MRNWPLMRQVQAGLTDACSTVLLMAKAARGAGGTEAGRMDRGTALGFAPGADQGDQQRIWAYQKGVDLVGPAMARIARDYGYALLSCGNYRTI